MENSSTSNVIRHAAFGLVALLLSFLSVSSAMAATVVADWSGDPDRVSFAPSFELGSTSTSSQTCAECKGGVTHLKLRYNGDTARRVVVVDGNHAIFDATVQPGGMIDLNGSESDGKFDKNELQVYVRDGNDWRLDTKIHVSCSKPINPGLKFGSFEVLDADSRQNGQVCSVDEGACAKCEGGATRLTLRYDGPGSVDVEIEDGEDVYFDGPVSSGQTFEIIGTQNDGRFQQNSLDIWIDGSRDADVHVSCSRPLEAGMQVGSFTIIAGQSRSGGAFCPADTPDPAPDPRKFCVADRMTSPYGFWLPGLDGRQAPNSSSATKLYSISNATFDELAGGTALLTGTILNELGEGFSIEITFSGRTSTPPTGSPKNGYNYTANTSDFVYYTGMSGWLYGLDGGDYDGAQVRVGRRGEAFQYGTGANLFDQFKLGGSAWLDWTVQTQPSTNVDLDWEGDGDINVTFDADCFADISLEKMATPMFASVGEEISFTITVTNQSSTTATNVDVTDYLPTQIAYVGGSANEGGSPSGNDVTWTIPSLAGGQSIDLTFLGTAIADGSARNCAEVSGMDSQDTDSTPGNLSGGASEDDESCYTVSIRPDGPMCMITDSTECITAELISVTDAAGETQYMVKITNNCKNAVSFVAFQLPAGATVADPSGSYSDGSFNYGIEFPTSNPFPHSLKFETNGEGAKDGQMTTFDFTLDGGFELDEPFMIEVKYGNNRDRLQLNTDCTPEIDLEIAKTVIGSDATSTGGEVTYELKVTNTSSETATGVTVQDSFPQSFAFVSASGDGSYDDNTGVWTVGTVGGNSMATIQVTMRADVTESGSDLLANGLYQLNNHPDGSARQPLYGLRLDRLFHDHQPITFDFEHQDSDVWMQVDGSSIIIFGQVFGGKDGGSTYISGDSGLWDLYFRYDNVIAPVPGDDDLYTTVETGSGTITPLFSTGSFAAGHTFNLTSHRTSGVSLRLGDHDNDLGHRGYTAGDGISGWGWLKHDGKGSLQHHAASDWLFTTGAFRPDTFVNCVEIASADQEDTDSTPSNGFKAGEDDNACAEITVTIPPPGRIAGNVYNDTNLNNQIDPNDDADLSGVKVLLFADTNNDGFGDIQIAMTFTNGVGFYEFDDLALGDYVVQIDENLDPPGALEAITANPADVALTAMNPSDEDVDFLFGPVRLASFGDTVYRDDNSNGVQDAGEPGISNVTVRLYMDNGGSPGMEITPAQVTNSAGHYEFTGLDPKGYIAEVIMPTGYMISDNNGDTFMDSADFFDAKVLAAGEDYNDGDFGFKPTGKISGFVWSDLDGEGDFDEANSGISGAIVSLLNQSGVPVLDANNMPITATTDGTGMYMFSNLPPGTYLVDVTAGQPGDTVATTPEPATVVLPLNGMEEADFGYAPTGSIMGKVREDTAGDVNLDGNEPGIDGVTVVLYNDENDDGVIDGSDTIAGSTVTDNGGMYLFEDLPGGDYLVDVDNSDPELGPNFPVDEMDFPEPRDVTLAVDEDKTDVDFLFGSVKMASVGDRVWLDLDGDGLQDNSEPGVAGAKVFLQDSGGFPVIDGNGVSMIETLADGFYDFVGLMPGTYQVAITPPTGLALTTPPNPMSGIVLTSGDDENGVDFGLIPAEGKIKVIVFDDANGNGIQDPFEVGHANVSVDVTSFGPNGINNGGTGDDVNLTLITDPDGMAMTAQNLKPGNYTVAVVAGTLPPTADNPTTPTSVSLNISGDETETVVFGYEKAESMISGVVFDDANDNGVNDSEAGLNQVTVTLYVDTDAVPDGVGDVVFDLTTTAQVSGEDGFYKFNDLPAGNYVVDVDNNDADLGSRIPTTPEPRSETVNGMNSAVNVDFGFVAPANKNRGSIGDYVWRDDDNDQTQDPGEIGVAGVEITLYNADSGGTKGTVVGTMNTNGLGFYQFDGLLPGFYVAEMTDFPAGYLASTGTMTGAIDLDPGENFNGADFGLLTTGMVEGKVFMDVKYFGTYESGTDMLITQTVDVRLIDDQGDEYAVQTISDGTYKFNNVPPGDYEVLVDTVIPNKVTSTGNPVDVTVLLNMPSWADIGFEDNTGMISGIVFDDLDGDGTMDALDPGLPGVRVFLYEDLDNDGAGDVFVQMVMTNDLAGPDGFYKFNNLVQGTYIVDVLNSDVAPRLATTTEPMGVQLDGPNDSEEVDFGFSTVANKMASIGDRVYRDDNGNGVQDSGEPGLIGVTVSITGPDSFSDSEVTDGTGFYEFTALMPGIHVVTITGGAAGYNPTQGSGGYTDDLAAGEDVNDADFGLRPTGTMEGIAFMDMNGNGIYDTDDTAIPDALVALLHPDMTPVVHENVAVTFETDSNGGYWFFNLAPGTYLVDLIDEPLDKVASTDDPLQVVVPTNANTAGHNIGYEPAEGMISGTVFDDTDGNTVQNGEPGLVGVTVNLFKDENGTLVPAGTDVTDINGDYKFNLLTQGNYVVDVDDNNIPAGLIATSAEPKSAAITTPTGTDTADFGYSLVANKMARIGDRVFRDDNGDGIQQPGEPGIQGVKVTLSGSATGVADTDAFGAYEFAGLMPGTYTVEVDTNDPEVNGYTDPVNPSFTKTLAAGEEYLSADFPFGPTGFLEGLVFMDVNGDGLYTGADMLIDGQTVTVTLFDDQGAQVATQEVSDGSYAFAGLAPGAYEVLVDETFAGKIASTGNPVDATVPLNDGAWANVGFEDNQGMIFGIVFNDVDGNGVQGPTEPGIPNVKITLFEDTDDDGVGDLVIDMFWTEDAGPTTTKGYYKFNNLVQGLYVVDVQHAPLEPLLATSAEPKPVELSGPGDSEEANFGFSTVANKMASVGDRVYRDDDGNGMQGPGEPGLSGVTVTINGPNGFSDFEVTDGSGFYEFVGLMPGDYDVMITAGQGDYTGTQGAGGYISQTLAAGQEVNDDDFGLRPIGSIEGFAFIDNNGDGTYDVDDDPITFATIELLHLDLSPVMHMGSAVTTTTDANGAYWFTNVAPGDFLVNLGTSFEPGDHVTSTGDPIAVTVPENGNTAGNDIGYEPATAEISGIVYKDDNGDGMLDAGEPGLSGKKVTLYNDVENDGVADGQVGMMTTGPNGDYLFENLPLGTYIVDVRDADVAPYLATSAEPKSVTIDDPLDAEVANFGFSELANKMASIGDRVYRDDNNNGSQDSGEPGLGTVTVTLTGPNGSVSQNTDPSGFYEFTGLMPGAYSVSVDPGDVSDYTPFEGAAGYNYNVSAGDEINEADFGYVPTGSIAGTLFNDDDGDGSFEPGDGETGLADPTLVELLDDNGDVIAGTFTLGGGDGSFSFPGLPPGDYQINVPSEPAGTQASTGNPIDVSVDLNLPTTGADVGFEQATSSIAGTAFGDEDANQVFDVTEDDLGDEISVTLYEDVDGSGTVNAGDSLVDDTETDSDGNYLFENLPQGEYLVDVGAVSGFLPTTDDPLAVTTDGVNPVIDQDFGFVNPNANVASIGDTIFQDTNGTGGQETGEPGIAGVQVSLFAADGVSTVLNADAVLVAPQTTDVSGSYVFTNLVPGTYVVRVTMMPALHVLTFDPDATQDAETEVTVAAGDDYVDADFGYQPKAGMISGTAFLDLDGDGVQDHDEPGIDDAAVHLLGAGPDGLFGTDDDLEVTIWTEPNGDYKFIDLPPGLYVVDVEDPENTSPTTPDPQDITVGPNENDTGNDFGYEPADNAISGTVFEDKNGDGDQDLGDNMATPAVDENEPGIPGITVTLIDIGPDGMPDTNDDTVVDSQPTDLDGNYLFDNIPSGTYRIESDAPSGLLATTANPVDESVDSGDTRDIDFGFNDNKMASIGDLVFEDLNGNGIQELGDVGIEGLTVNLYKDGNGNGVIDGAESIAPAAFTSTNAAGFYSFQLLPPGTYFVDVVPPAGGGFVPTGSENRGNERAPIVVVSGTTVQDADYGYQPVDGSIRVTLFQDSNGNGTQEPGEAGLLARNVTLTGPAGLQSGTQTGTTDSNGEFWFTDLVPGVYTVSATGPAGTTQTGSNPEVNLGSNEILTAELGYRSVNSAISGTTFGDLDGDGVFDVNETSVGPIPVKLIGPGPDGVFGGGDDVVVATTTSTGTYNFPGLAPGEYRVEVTAPGTMVVTTSNPLAITLMANETETANFGFNSNKMASIGDTIYEDLNGNGVQDPGDTGLAGVDVKLYLDDGNGIFEAGSDTPFATQTTNSAGIYDFTGLNPGTYFVDVLSNPAYAETGDSEGAPDDPDNITGGELTAITVSDGQDINGADYGLMPKRGEIHGIVFDDTNGNGVRDPGEAPVPWITIRLRSWGPDGNQATTADNVNLTLESNSVGKYWFTNLAPGDYWVRPVSTDIPAGSTVTTPLPIPVTIGGNTVVNGVNHGLQTRNSSITGIAFEDQNGNGVDDGEPAIPGGIVTLINVGPDGLLGGGDDSVAGNTQTDGSGNYAFAGLPPGNYQVTVTPPAGLVATTANPKPVVLGAGDSGRADFGFNNNKMASIGDLIFRDDNSDGIQNPGEPGLAGVQVKLFRDGPGGLVGFYDVSDAQVGTRTTDNAGFYDFTALSPGIYFVDVVTPSGFVATGAGPFGDEKDPIEVLSGDDENGADYGFLPMNGVVTGTVFNDLNGNGEQDSNEPGLPDVPVVITGPGGFEVETTTNAQGGFTVAGLIPGAYTVTVDEASPKVPDGALATTGNPVHVDVESGQASEANVGYQTRNSTIEGITFTDVNGNGVYDAGDSVLAGVPIKLINLGPNNSPGGGDDYIHDSVNSDTNGEYDFAGVPPGTYQVEATAPNGVVSTSSNPLTVGVQPDEVETANFGFNTNKMASIGDTVFEDLNANGLQDSGEVGIEGIELTLYLDDGDGDFEPSNDTVLTTATTNSAGIYDFTGLNPGTYFVTITMVSGLNPTGGTRGLPGEAITVTDNTDINDADYGLLPSTGEVHGVVFDDVNKNGVQDPGEAGHQGFLVAIYGPGPDGDYETTVDNVAVTTTTDADGAYWQDGLPPGDYVVNVDETAAPFGSVSTTPDPAFIWIGGGSIVTTNFGIMLPGGVVRGIIFSDDDQNGVQNGDEQGLANVAVTLFDLGLDGTAGSMDDGPSRIVMTAANGAYIITGLPDSKYLLSVDDPPGTLATSTEPRPVTISGGTTEEENVGYATAKMAQIGDTVYQDLDGDGTHDMGEPGISGVTVTLYLDLDEDGFLDASEVGTGVFTLTNSAGIYNFVGLMPGFYLVQATEPSQHEATGNTDPLAFEVISGQIVETADFGFLPTGGSISGIVFGDTDGDGTIGAGELGLGGVTVTVSSDGPDGTPATGDEIEEVLVTIPDGTYSATSLPPGDYTVAFETPDGTAATTPNPETVELSANEAESLQTGFAPVTGTIDGIVFNDVDGDGIKDNGEGGIGGVTLNLFGPGPDRIFGTADDEPIATTTSVSTGGYWFTDVPVGPYRLDLVDSTAPAGTTVSTGNDPSDLIVQADEATTVLFGLNKADRPKATIAGKVFDDKNKNGQYDSGDAGFPSVTVKLFTLGADYKCGTPDDQFKAAKTTDGSGNYAFTGLHPGTYCVLVDETTLPGDVSPTTGGNPATVYVEAGQTKEANFGYTGGGKIDLEIAKTANKTSVAVGDEVTFTITVRNTAEAHVSATNVFVKDYLPTGLQYVWDSATTGQGLTFNPTQLTWQIEWIGVNKEVHLSLRAKVTKPGEFKNCAEVWDADQKDKDSRTGVERGTPFNSSTSREDDEDCHRIWTGTSAKIDLELDKSVDNAYPTVGSKVTYTLAVSNNGSTTATGVMVTDYLPQGLSYVWDTATTGQGLTFNPSQLKWTLTSLAVGETRLLQLQATVNQSGEWINYAEVWDADQEDVDSEPGEDRGTPFNPYAPREDDEAEASVWVGIAPAYDAICYIIADNENTPWGSRDVLSKLTSQGRVETIIGRTGTLMIESMAFNPWTGVLYAADANSLGTINLQTGHYTDIGEFGYGEGWMANGEYRTRGLLDADGLAFDALNGDLWASSRKTGEPDLLFKIDPATGAHVPNAFGPGKDFISILTNDGLNDIDDIAIDPTNGKLYAINNEGGTQSRLVTIDKQTGWITEIKDLPIGNIEGLDFFGDGTLYATAGEGDEAIVIIDKATLTTQIVTSIGTGGNRDYEAIACLTSPTNRLQVTVFEDVNDNGQQDGVEVPLVGVDIELFRDVDGDGLISVDDPRVQTGLSDSNGEVTFRTAARGKFVYRMAGGFVRGVGIQTGANLEGFGLLSRSYMAVGASTATGADEESELPTEYQLYRNYPNPFNPATTISFDLPQTERVTLAVFDVLGRRVAVLMDGITQAGNHEVRFDGRRFASGTYIYRMTTPTRTLSQTMILIK